VSEGRNASIRYLVTGGAGFIGSCLSAALIKSGHQVVVLDNLSSGRVSNLASFVGHSAFKFIPGNCEDFHLVKRLISSCDRVFHLAAIVGVLRVLKSPAAAMSENYAMTEAVLESCASMNCPVLFASSSEVYGRSRELPFREDGDLVLGPPGKGRWAYAVSKLAGEHLALALHRQRGLPVVVARLFNTTGPGQSSRHGMVLPTFIEQARSGEALTVIGDGLQTRCFVHVDDVVRALLMLIAAPKGYGQVYNVGSTTPISIVKLSDKVRQACNSTSKLVHIQPSSLGPDFDEMPGRVPDTTKIYSEFGWHTTKNIDQIIADAIARSNSELLSD
jgi:UDP-glucose 4-epimerase